jgi:hypothetical protein
VKMGKSPVQGKDERTLPITYRAEIYANREGGQEVRLDRNARGSSIGGLAEDLVAQVSELGAEAQEKLDQAETENSKKKQTDHEAELSGRRWRSW